MRRTEPVGPRATLTFLAPACSTENAGPSFASGRSRRCAGLRVGEPHNVGSTHPRRPRPALADHICGRSPQPCSAKIWVTTTNADRKPLGPPKITAVIGTQLRSNTVPLAYAQREQALPTTQSAKAPSARGSIDSEFESPNRTSTRRGSRTTDHASTADTTNSGTDRTSDAHVARCRRPLRDRLPSPDFTLVGRCHAPPGSRDYGRSAMS